MNGRTFLNKGELERGKKDDKGPDLDFTSAKDFFSAPANLIPGIGGVSGGRVLLGSKATLQAISLVNREAPLVQSVASEADQSFVSQYGKELMCVKAQEAGTVEDVNSDEILIKDASGHIHTYDLYNNFPLGRKTFMQHFPKVKVGDHVKKGDLLAVSNYTDDKGNLALGTNLRTAVMPYRSGNFEDAWVVTESGAKKLEAEQLIKHRVEKKLGVDTKKNQYISLFPNKYFNKQLDTIDADGAVKPGTIVNYGDPVLLAYSPKALKSTDIALGKLSKVLKNAYKDQAQTWHYEHPGEVIDVSKSGDLITVTLKTKRGLSVGDKVCLTEDHEVLTTLGWKFIKEILTTDQVYTLDPSNQRIELLAPAALISFDYTGQMYNLETTQVSMCVTPEHKIYAQLRTGRRGFTNDYKLIRAKDLFGKRYKLKKNGVWIGHSPETVKIGDQDVPIATYLTILGLFLGDGNIFWQPKKGDYGFDISQKKPAETLVIKDVLTSLGIKYYQSDKSFRVYSKAWAAHLKQFGKAKDKFIPQWVFGCTAEHLQILYKYLMLTDGSEKSSTHSYCTISKQLADDVQRLTICIGYSARIEFVKGGHEVTFPNGITSIASDCYRVYIYRVKNEPEINHGHTKRQGGQLEQWLEFSGKVYCLSFEKNHIFYVRRNGVTHWTGNSNAWGAKGVVGSIIADSQAPQDKDGKPVDMILNSMSITSRVAPALAVTLGLGKVAEKTGKPVKFAHFNEKPAINKAIDSLKEHGISDTERLYDPVTGQHIEVLTGPLYFTRLIHIAEDKESSSSETPGWSWDFQPTRSGEESTKRIGNLSTASLLSHGATAVLRDFALVKATKNDEFWRNLKLGLPAPSPKVPFIFDKFIASLHGAGVKVDKKGDVFSIMPMVDKDIMAMSAGEIDNARTFKAKGDKILPEAGGLFDPAKVGIFGDKYNHINLNFSVPNPISEDYLRKLLGVTQKAFEDLVIKGALKAKLEAINVDEKLKEYQAYLKSGKKTHREDSIKVLSFLRTLKEKGIKPVDLMLTKIPIIPAQYRPMQDQGGMVLSSPVNTLYKELIQNNDALQNTEFLPEELQHNLRNEQYNAVKAVFGLGEPITIKSREKGIKGLLSTTLGTQGGSAKTTMFQAKVVNKPLSLVGRAVLTPDARLDLDEASIPQDTLWKIYKPFIIRRLVMKGVPATKAAEYVKYRNPLATQALMEEASSRPGIISRDPSLHKFNLTGFYLRPNPDPKDKTIKLNPLVFKSFNADNDGDQLNVNIPPTEESRLEVIDKMLPSRNLLSPKTFQPIYTPGNEAALGLFQSSTTDNKNSPVRFTNNQDVIKAFNQGKIDIGDRVEIG